MTGPDARPALREVAPRIRRIDLPLGARFVSLYLVVGDERTLLFDAGVTGMIGDFVLPAMRSIGLDPEDVGHVVISHCDVDHFGGMTDARAAFPAARLIAHEQDAAAIEDFGAYLVERGDSFRAFGWSEDPETLAWARSVTAESRLDTTVSGGEEIDLGGVLVRILHVPGHSRGHLALHVPASGALLVADAVLGRSVDLADGTPAFPPTYRFVDDYLASISALRSLDARLLLTAHNPSFEGAGVEQFLLESRDFAIATEQLTLSILRESGPLAFRDLLARANSVAGRWPKEGTLGALAFPVAGHLERLESNGAVYAEGEGESKVWRSR